MARISEREHEHREFIAAVHGVDLTRSPAPRVGSGLRSFHEKVKRSVMRR